jgi:hypothetical protein
VEAYPGRSFFDAVLVSGYFYTSAWISIAAAKWYGIPLLFITDSHSLQSWAAQSKWKLRIKKILVRKFFHLERPCWRCRPAA